MERLQKHMKLLTVSVGVLGLVVLGLIAVIFFFIQRRSSFKEITAQRINIVEQDGTLRMAISNRKMQDPGAFDGKKISQRDRPAGIIFFNDLGDECGGIVYDGDRKNASMTYSFDQFKNDQIMQLQYAQDQTGTSNMNRSYGLKMWDRDDRFPTAKLLKYTDSLKSLKSADAYQSGIAKIRAAGWLGEERMFIGKNSMGEYGIFIKDANGTLRLQILVNRQNKPVIKLNNN